MTRECHDRQSWSVDLFVDLGMSWNEVSICKYVESRKFDVHINTRFTRSRNIGTEPNGMGRYPGLRWPTIFAYSRRHGRQRSLGYLHHLGIMDPYSPYSHDIPMIISLKNLEKDHVPTRGFQRFQLGIPNVISKWTNIRGGETWEKNLRKRRSRSFTHPAFISR